ncbi:hypothetical protein ABK040_011923 [Willaertia magna]
MKIILFLINLVVILSFLFLSQSQSVESKTFPSTLLNQLKELTTCQSSSTISVTAIPSDLKNQLIELTSCGASTVISNNNNNEKNDTKEEKKEESVVTIGGWLNEKENNLNENKILSLQQMSRMEVNLNKRILKLKKIIDLDLCKLEKFEKLVKEFKEKEKIEIEKLKSLKLKLKEINNKEDEKEYYKKVKKEVEEQTIIVKRVKKEYSIYCKKVNRYKAILTTHQTNYNYSKETLLSELKLITKMKDLINEHYKKKESDNGKEEEVKDTTLIYIEKQYIHNILNIVKISKNYIIKVNNDIKLLDKSLNDLNKLNVKQIALNMYSLQKTLNHKLNSLERNLKYVKDVKVQKAAEEEKNLLKEKINLLIAKLTNEKVVQIVNEYHYKVEMKDGLVVMKKEIKK